MKIILPAKLKILDYMSPGVETNNTQIYKKTDMCSSAISGFVGELIKEGYIERVPKKKKDPKKFFKLTKKGEEVSYYIREIVEG